MEVIYLPGAVPDIIWLTHYYDENFPAGRVNMRMQLYATELLLEQSPYLGRVCEDVEGTREIQVTKTPFSLIYRVTNTHVEILRVWDQRRDRSNLKV